MSCARCSQSKTLFPEATSCIKAKTLDPLSNDTTVQAAIEVEGCAGQWEIPGTRRKKRSLHTDYLEGRAVAAARAGQRG